ncbi:hypothetical protein AAVH_07035 [Aphelenchoides avenae]|nr:hypothetical protein AAVH_07035 [Aphelenchus avenae]
MMEMDQKNDLPEAYRMRNGGRPGSSRTDEHHRAARGNSSQSKSPHIMQRSRSPRRHDNLAASKFRRSRSPASDWRAGPGGVGRSRPGRPLSKDSRPPRPEHGARMSPSHANRRTEIPNRRPLAIGRRSRSRSPRMADQRAAPPRRPFRGDVSPLRQKSPPIRLSGTSYFDVRRPPRRDSSPAREKRIRPDVPSRRKSPPVVPVPRRDSSPPRRRPVLPLARLDRRDAIRSRRILPPELRRARPRITGRADARRQHARSPRRSEERRTERRSGHKSSSKSSRDDANAACFPCLEDLEEVDSVVNADVLMADIIGDHSTAARQVVPSLCKTSDAFSKHPSDAARNGHGRHTGHRRHMRRGSTDYDTDDEELDANEGNIAQFEDTSDLDEGDDPQDLHASHRASQKQPKTDVQDNAGAVNGNQLFGGELKQDISEQQADAHSEHTSAVGSALEELIDDELDYDEAEDTATPKEPSAQPEPTVPDEPELRQSNGAAEPRDSAPDVKQEVPEEAPAGPGKPQEDPSNAETDGKTRRRIISLKSVKASCVVNDPTRTERAIPSNHREDNVSGHATICARRRKARAEVEAEMPDETMESHFMRFLQSAEGPAFNSVVKQ